MVSELELKEIIGKVLKEMAVEGTSVNNEVKKPSASASVIENGIIDDITKEDLREVIELKNPANREEFLKYKRKTPARLGISRAGLEDHFMGKLHGLPMGVDVCYTNHMKADQSDVEVLATLLTAAGCNYFMGIPAGDDIMLNYQTTGFHDNQSLRELFGKHPIKEFKEWLVKYGFMTEDGKLTEKAGDPSVFLK